MMNTSRRSVIKIETLPSLLVGCYRAISESPEHDSIDHMRQWLAKKDLRGPPVRIFGFDVDIPKEDSDAGRRGYETWMTIPSGTRPSEGVKVTAFQGGLYATMTLIKPFDDPFEHIPNGWKVLHEWVLTNEKYQGGPHQWLEELIVHEDGDDLKLYHPIAAKAVPA